MKQVQFEISHNFLAPILHTTYRRGRLIEWLTDEVNSERQVIHIQAPTGYGKTTLLADFALNSSIPTCWYSLDAAAQSKTHFILNFISIVIKRFPELSYQYLNLDLEKQASQIELDMILDMLSKIDSHILIFDNLDCIFDTVTASTLLHLIEKLPATTNLILSGRTNFLKFVPKHVAKHIGLLGVEDLRFTVEEIQGTILKQSNNQITSKDAEALYSAFDGNIAKILLVDQLTKFENKSAKIFSDPSMESYLLKNLTPTLFGKHPSPLQQNFDEFTEVAYQNMIYLNQSTESYHQADDLEVTKAHIIQAVNLSELGEAEQAITLIEGSLEKLTQLRVSADLMGWAICQRGIIFNQVDNVPAAIADFREALSLARRSDNEQVMGLCYHYLGVLLADQGNFSGANHNFEEAIKLWQTLGYWDNLLDSRYHFGQLLLNAGQNQEAQRHFQDNLELAQSLNRTAQIAKARIGLADVERMACQYKLAIQSYNEVIDLTQDEQAQSLKLWCLIALAECKLAENSLNEAHNLASRVVAIATELQLIYAQGVGQFLLAKIFVRQSDYPASLSKFSEAFSYFSKRNKLEQAKIQLWWSLSLFANLQISAASKKLEQAFSLIHTLNELEASLTSTIKETQLVLYYFLHSHKTSVGLRDKLFASLKRNNLLAGVKSGGLHFFAFGVPILIVNGKRHYFNQRGRGQDLSAVLAYLFVESQKNGFRWEKLATDFWPNLSRSAAHSKFHQNIRRLRDAFCPSSNCILQESDYYRINPDYYQWSDIIVFEQLYERISKAAPIETLYLQLELIELYEGEFLTGFDLPDWARQYREKCEKWFIDVVDRASTHLIKDQRLWKALEILQKGVSVDNLQEGFHCKILRLYHQLGLHSQMKQHYVDICSKIGEEIDTFVEMHQVYAELSAKSAD